MLKKNNPKIDKKQIDNDFTAIWKSTHSPADWEHLAEYIRSNYFPLAYAFAGKLFEGLAGTQKYEDAVSSLVVEVMEDIVTTTRKGTLSYRGTAAFSSYLFSALKLKKLESRKIYYPREVERLGMAAKHAYRLLLIEDFEETEVLRIIQDWYELSAESTRTILNLIHTYSLDEVKRRRDRGEYHHDDSLERIYEDTPYKTPHTGTSALTEYLRKHEIELLYSAINGLEPTEQAIIRGYMIEGRWRTIAEMEAELHLKNGAYALKKIKKKLAEILEPQLIEPADAASAGSSSPLME